MLNLEVLGLSLNLENGSTALLVVTNDLFSSFGIEFNHSFQEFLCGFPIIKELMNVKFPATGSPSMLGTAKYGADAVGGGSGDEDVLHAFFAVSFETLKRPPLVSIFCFVWFGAPVTLLA